MAALGQDAPLAGSPLFPIVIFIRISDVMLLASSIQS